MKSSSATPARKFQIVVRYSTTPTTAKITATRIHARRAGVFAPAALMESLKERPKKSNASAMKNIPTRETIKGVDHLAPQPELQLLPKPRCGYVEKGLARLPDGEF
jgi:hypothetical protein